MVRCGAVSHIAVSPDRDFMVVYSISPVGQIEIIFVWKLHSANFKIMHGYGVLAGYAFESPVVENDWTVPLNKLQRGHMIG